MCQIPRPLFLCMEIVYPLQRMEAEGFCDEARKAIYQYMFALAHGAGVLLSLSCLAAKGLVLRYWRKLKLSVG